MIINPFNAGANWRWDNFRLREVQCHCDKAKEEGKPVGVRYPGCKVVLVDSRLLDFLQAVRTASGQPLSRSCAYRCPMHNEAVGGKPETTALPGKGSQHLYGLAADIKRRNLPDDFGTALDILVGSQCGFHEYDWGWHVDLRGTRSRW